MIAGLITTSLATQLIIMLIAFGVLILKKDLKRYAKLISIYFIVTGIVDLSGTILALNGYSNALLFRIFSLFELLLLSTVFIEIEKEETWVNAIGASAVVTVILIVLGNFQSHDSRSFPIFFMALPNLVLFIISLRGFYFTTISKVNPAKEAQLWFSLGFSFYFAINSIALLFWQGELIFIGTTISIVNNIIKNILMAGSYLCLIRQAIPLSAFNK